MRWEKDLIPYLPGASLAASQDRVLGLRWEKIHAGCLVDVHYYLDRGNRSILPTSSHGVGFPAPKRRWENTAPCVRAL